MNEEKTILLVDDSEDDLFLMRLAFKKAEFNTKLQEVRDGEDAIAYLKGIGRFIDRNEHPLPAVVLLDLNMPKKSGFDLLAWLRTQPGLRRLSVIVLTASMREEDMERAFDLGANSYLVKPAKVEDLTSMIRTLRYWLQYNHFPPLNENVKRI